MLDKWACAMKKVNYTFKKISHFFYLSFILLVFSTTLKAQPCDFVSVNTNSNPFTSCLTGIITITGTLTVNSNYMPNNVTELRISGSSARIDFTGNFTLTLPAGAKLTFINGGQITIPNGGGCNNSKLIVIGTQSASCDGTGGANFSFSQVNTGGGFSSSGLLPITLVDFTPTQVGNTIALKWETASEKDNAYMEVQRSKDGIHFIALHQEKGHGTTGEPQHYDWVDTRPLPGTNYYRLKQVDYNGNYEYHKIESIEFKGKTADPGLQLYPTEVKDVLTVVLESPTSEDASLLVVDALGRVVQRHRLAIGSTLEEVQLSALPRGQYFITLQSGNSLQTARFMKM